MPSESPVSVSPETPWEKSEAAAALRVRPQVSCSRLHRGRAWTGPFTCPPSSVPRQPASPPPSLRLDICHVLRPPSCDSALCARLCAPQHPMEFWATPCQPFPGILPATLLLRQLHSRSCFWGGRSAPGAGTQGAFMFCPSCSPPPCLREVGRWV